MGIRAALLASSSKKGLTSFERLIGAMQDRITFTAGERYERLRGWIETYQRGQPIPLDHFFSRLYGEILAQPGFNLHSDLDAAQAVAALDPVRANAGALELAPEEALRRLEQLRVLLDTLHIYSREGPPLSYRMGLWSGSALLDAARPVWFEGFRGQLYSDTWKVLVDSLRALPSDPTASDDYLQAYNRLAAYLITTDEHARSTPEFLSPVLLALWQRGEQLDEERVALAGLQFDHFATELATEHPFAVPRDERLVSSARSYLGRFTGAESIYQAMRGKAAAGKAPIRLIEAVPNSAGVLSSSGQVSQAFTREGWTVMQDKFRNPDPTGEEWVLGNATAALVQDRDKVIAELRRRYQRDLIDQWRAFLRSTSVLPSRTPPEAARKLGVLGVADSPLLGLFALVARNTDVDSITSAAFQPVHMITPPDIKDKLISEANQPYATSLMELQGALKFVAELPNSDSASAAVIRDEARSASAQVTRAKVAAQVVQQKFFQDSAARQVGPVALELLLAPISSADAMLQQLARARPNVRIATAPRPVVPVAPSAGGGGGASPADVLNKAGVELCRTLSGLTAKYPFNASARTEATTGDLMEVLAPETGALWVFQLDKLARFIEQRGNTWIARAGAPLALSDEFLAFFNRASRVSAAMFPNGAREPRIEGWALAMASKDVQPITLRHGEGDGSTASFNTDTPRNALEWPTRSGSGASLEARFGRSNVKLAEEKGDWALVRLIAKGKPEWNGRELRAQYTTGNRPPVTVIYTFQSGLPMMQEGYLGTALNCPAPVVKP